jgi:hypothetical protein
VHTGQVFERRCLVDSLPAQAPPAKVVDPCQRGVIDLSADTELETHGSQATQPARAGGVAGRATHASTGY